eukprot:CCRYP_017245-RA/>CCRYP_017245-RA protein AED:0.44 eAED:0.44 QI:148/1/1/1/1/1/2/114/434
MFRCSDIIIHNIKSSSRSQRLHYLQFTIFSTVQTTADTSNPILIMISVSASMGAVVNHLRNFIFDEKATAIEILPIVVMFAVLWYVTFFILRKIIRKLVHNKQWLIEALERDYDRSAKKIFDDLKMEMTKEEAIQWSMNDWPRMQCIYLQHFIGSLFCIPSLLGMGDPYVTSSLACLGVLSEMGWEVQDMAEIFFVRTFHKNGKEVWPDSIVFIFALHHSLTTVLGVPMIIYYRTHRALHWLCFDLQMAGFLGLALGEYTKLLNVNEPKQLGRFKIANLVALVTMTWTRVFHWTYLCGQLFVTWYNDRAWVFLVFGVILSIGFSMFSFLVCVKPFYKKFIKLLHVSEEYEKLPLDAAIELRRASTVNLELAVAELLEENETRDLSHVMESIFASRQVSRRHTVSIAKSVPQQVIGRKRHSLIMAKDFAEKLKQK